MAAKRKPVTQEVRLLGSEQLLRVVLSSAHADIVCGADLAHLFTERTYPRWANVHIGPGPHVDVLVTGHIEPAYDDVLDEWSVLVTPEMQDALSPANRTALLAATAPASRAAVNMLVLAIDKL